MLYIEKMACGKQKMLLLEKLTCTKQNMLFKISINKENLFIETTQ